MTPNDIDELVKTFEEIIKREDAKKRAEELAKEAKARKILGFEKMDKMISIMYGLMLLFTITTVCLILSKLFGG